MARRTNTHLTQLEVSGYDPKNTSKKMYAKIWQPSETKTMTDQDYYIYKSYKSICELVLSEPSETGVMLPLDFIMDDRMRKYQHTLKFAMKTRRMRPYMYLPHTNSREVEYKLSNLNLGYCAETGQAHRWKCFLENNNYSYKCKKCGILYDDIKFSANKSISQILHQNMQKEAFFELYMISCPIKDAHIWENEKCTQCKVAKEQLLNSDEDYFKKYSDTFQQYTDNIRAIILKEASDVVKDVKSIDTVNKKETQKDPESLKLLIESTALELSKYVKFNTDHIINLGITAETDGRSISIIKSFITVIYSHITFVKNLKLETMIHPDGTFIDLLDKYYLKGIEVEKSNINIPDSTLLESSLSANNLLLKMLKMLVQMFSESKTEADTELLKFIVDKIVKQNNRRQSFDPTRIKASISKALETSTAAIIVDEDEEELENPFDGYDIDEEDAEDNIDGDID